jgi:hypothetical protein
MRLARIWVVCGVAASAGMPQALAQQCAEQKLAAPDGPGVKVTKDCIREEGTFRGGRLWGKAKVTQQDGTVHEGEFIDGRLWGYGKMTRGAPFKGWHEGLYHNGVPTGAGRSGDEHGIVANGFFYGTLYGAAVLTYPNGGKLKGEFRPNGGVGDFVATFPDGSTQTGPYKEMYSKVYNYRPSQAPPLAKSAEPTKSVEPKTEETAKGKIEPEKAIDVLRGLLKR